MLPPERPEAEGLEVVKTPAIAYSRHALRRMRERELRPATVEKVLRDPVTSGPIDSGDFCATGPVLLGKRHDWLTVIYRPVKGELLVLSAYLGKPTAANRRLDVEDRKAGGSST